MGDIYSRAMARIYDISKVGDFKNHLIASNALKVLTEISKQHMQDFSPETCGHRLQLACIDKSRASQVLLMSPSA